jgi:hypothetical protein
MCRSTTITYVFICQICSPGNTVQSKAITWSEGTGNLWTVLPGPSDQVIALLWTVLPGPSDQVIALLWTVLPVPSKISKIELNLRLSQDSPRSPILQPSGHTPVASIHEPFIQLSGLLRIGYSVCGYWWNCLFYL